MWNNRKDICLFPVPATELLKPFHFLSGKGDRSVLCSKVVTVGRLGAGLQEDWALIKTLELSAPRPLLQGGERVWRLS